MSAFEKRYGFRRDEVRLDNWRTSPFCRYAFQYAREILPTAEISCGVEQAEEPSAGAGTLGDTRLRIGGEEVGFAGFLERSHSDGFLAMKSGRIVSEWTAPHAARGARHILFSVSKSLTGLLAGILEDHGRFDPEAPVTAYLPEAAASAYGTATGRQLLDMRVSLDFEESYLDRDGDYARYRRATGWNPLPAGARPETMAEMLFSLRRGPEPHGGAFRYLSPNTDVLGLVLARAAGESFAALMSRLVWRPLGAFRHAYVTLDAAGAPRAAGGICATAHDLARIGEMVRLGGRGAAGRVVSERWVEDMRRNGDSEAWTRGNASDFLSNGRYRSCWYQAGYESGAYCCIGIHGQWLYVDPTAETVLVKLSSQPDPVDEMLDRHCLEFFRAVSAIL